jgi:hypothetical protein
VYALGLRYAEDLDLVIKKFLLTVAFGLTATAMTAFATPVCSNNVAGNGAAYPVAAYN